VSAQVGSGDADCTDIATVRSIVDGYLDLAGIDALRGWSTEYTYGTCLTDLIAYRGLLTERSSPTSTNEPRR
jgi:hypothetical protein